ncbi:MAG: hypothetical protein WC825_01965 [Gallionellaceae bacterium]|jgi:hypothetical protein
MTNIWCKKLRLIELLVFWGKSLFVPLTVYHDEYVATFAAKKLLALAQHWGACRNFLPANLDFDERDEDGYGLIYLANRRLSLCCESFLSQHAPTADERYRQMLKTYVRVHLELQILFITYVEAKIRSAGIQNNVIVVEPDHLNSMLTDYYAECGITVKSVCNFTKVFRARLMPFIYFIKHLVAKVTPGEVKGNINTIRPSVWVEYYDDDRGLFGFWIKHVNANDYDIVYYLDRSDTPVAGARTAKIEKNDLKWIDGHRDPLFQLGNVPLHMLAGWLFRSIVPSGRPAWFRGFQFQERMWYHTYLAVFSKFQVKVLIQHQDRGWLQAVQAHAMEDVGGIMVGFHWSNLPYCMDNFFLNSQHVYFVWGKPMYDCLQRKGHTSKHILPSGIWMKPTSGKRPPQLDEMNPNLEFIFSVYDSDVTHGAQQCIVQTTESLAAFFLCILDMLEANPRWGAALKLKHKKLSDHGSILPRGAEIIGRMRRLMEQKRLVELDSEVSPITASENTDLAVCYALNSAGIVSGIFGCPAVHWDCVGQPNPFSKDPNQQIFFRTLGDLSQAVQRAAAGDKSVGDFSPWVKDYNYFGDFQGDKRIGSFIQAYMEEMVTSRSAKFALASAVKHYNNYNKISEYPFAN